MLKNPSEMTLSEPRKELSAIKKAIRYWTTVNVSNVPILVNMEERILAEIESRQNEEG
jgi:hypothetical protein